MGDSGGNVLKEGRVAFDRILTRDLFLSLLDFEIKRARRYQNFICLILLTINQFSRESGGDALKICCRALGDLLTGEIRESDMIGFLESDKLVLLLPYADSSAGSIVISRIQEALEYRNFKGKGAEVLIEQVCYPAHGTDVHGLLGEVLQ